MAVTGHRNEKSLDDYVDSMNSRQARDLSSIICGGKDNWQLANPSTTVCRPTQLTAPRNYAVPPASDQPLIHISGVKENATIHLSFNNYFNTATTSAATSAQSVYPVYKRIRRVIESDDEDDN